MKFFIHIFLLLTLTTTFQHQIKAGQSWSTPIINQQELLLTAIRENKVDAINTAITNGADPVKIYDTGQNLIHVAAENGSTESLNLLLTKINTNKLKEYIDAQDNLGNSPLHLSSLKNHTNVTTILLAQQGIKIQIKNKKGNTPLHLAALKNHTEILNLLLNKEKNLNINIKNNSGNRPLHLAASKNSLETLQRLLKLHRKNLEINAQNNDGDTALHFAAKYNANQTLKALMDDNRINLNIKNKNDETAKDLALENDNEPVLNVFAKILEAELEQAKTELEEKQKELEEKQKELALRQAQDKQKNKKKLEKKEKLNQLQKLEKLEKEIKELSINKLRTQNQINQLKIKIHKKKRYQNYLNDTATKIQSAFRDHNTRQEIKQNEEAMIKIQKAFVEGFIKKQKESEFNKQKRIKTKDKRSKTVQRINKIKESLLTFMSELGTAENSVETKKITWLKKLAPKIMEVFTKLKDKNNHTVLHLFATYGLLDKNLIQKFTDNSGDINAQNNSGETALHLSILNGYDEQSEILINLNADITIIDNQKDSPLHWAILAHNSETLLTQESNNSKPRDNTELIRRLINEKTINAKDNEGNTPLHLAAYNAHINLIETLVNGGANVNAQNKKGGTSLHLAAIQNHTKTVEELIKFQASVLKKNYPVKPAKKGFTPWDYVKDKEGFEETTNILDKAYLPQLQEKNPRRYNQVVKEQKRKKK